MKRLLVVLLVTLVVAGRSFAQWEGPPLACDCGPDAAVRVIGDGACTCVPFRPTATPSPTPTATATPTATRTATPTVTVTPTPTVSATPTATATAQPELGTHTTGDYVADATSGGGLTKTGTEGATLGITPCSDGQIQKFSGGAWGCAADATGGGAGNSFETFNAPNGTDPVADNATDTLNITCPAPLVCTGDSSTDTLTIALGPTPTATPTATPTPTVTVTPTPTVTVTATQTPTPYPTLNGDVDGDMGANDLDELAVESELESVLDLEDLQGSLACADVTGCVENALTSEVDGSTTNELQNIFETIDAPSGTDPVADSTTDTLALAASGIVTITGNATTDTITIGATEVDGSTTNEINTVTADAGGATSGLGITLAGGGIVSTARSGDTVTITGTEVDGSTTNEINTITADSGGATSGLGITLAGGGIVATARSGNTVTITGTETDPQVGTVSTSGRFCTADGSAIQCATAANGGTDITADLEEETHATEHSAGGPDPVTVTNLASGCTDAQTLGGTSGGTGVECQTDDDVPEQGDFGALDPTACPGGQYMTDITSGAAVCAQVAFSELSGSATDAQIPNSITIDSANTVEGTDLGTLTNGRLCSYDSANTEIDCDTVDDDVPESGDFTNLSGTSPITVSGGAVSIQNAAADGSTKGAAAFNSTDFDSTSGVISLDANVVKVGGAAILSSQIPTVFAADGVSRCLGDDNDWCAAYNATFNMVLASGVTLNIGPTPTATPTATVTTTPTSTSATATATAATPTIIATPTVTGATATPTAVVTPGLLVRGQELRCVAFCSGTNQTGTLLMSPTGATSTNTANPSAVAARVPFTGYFRDAQCATWQDVAAGGRSVVEVQSGTCTGSTDGAIPSCSFTPVIRADLVGTKNPEERYFNGAPIRSGTITMGALWYWRFVDTNTAGGGWRNCCVRYCPES